MGAIAALCSFGTAEGSFTQVETRLKRYANEARIASLVIAKDGRRVFQIETPAAAEDVGGVEMTEACLSLAVSFLIEEKKIPCFDSPVWLFHPCWKSQWSKKLTLRHLLNHTAGLETFPKSMSKEALWHVQSVYEPGTHYYRNEQNGRLLINVIEAISGQSVEEYLLAKLFLPLNIHQVIWRKSAASSPQVALSSEAWIKIGNFLAQRGRFCGKSLLDAHIVEQLLTPSQPFDPFFWSAVVVELL